MSGHRVSHDMAKAPLSIVDPGAGGNIAIDRHDAIVELESEAVETRTLYDPERAGLRCTIRLATYGGEVTLTAANGLNVAGNETAVFADVGDQLEFVSVSHTSGYRWEVISNTGTVVLS